MAFYVDSDDATLREMCELGEDVLKSGKMQALRTFIQHGAVTRYEHCLSVSYIALELADKLRRTWTGEAWCAVRCCMISSCMTGMTQATCG